MAHIAAYLLAMAGTAYGQLTLSGVKCGQLKCAVGEYCSPDTDRCSPCTDVCNDQHHNFDAGLCAKECQGYIHDLLYVRRSDGAIGTNSPPPDLKSVQQQARIAIIISSVALAVLAIILLMKCLSLFKDHRGKFSWKHLGQKFQKSKNQVKQYPMDLTHHNPHAEMAKPRHEHRLDIQNSNPDPPLRANRPSQPLNVRDLEKRDSQTERSQGATTPKTMSTNLSNRHPAEDTTLDYSYDNKGLKLTPPSKPSASHNF